MTESIHPELPDQEAFSARPSNPEQPRTLEEDPKLESMFVDACAMIELSPRIKQTAQSFVSATRGQAISKGFSQEEQRRMVALADMVSQKYLSEGGRS